MRAKTGSSSADREAILYEWYRAKLKELLPPLLSKWETALGVSAAEWGLKRMRTRWGSCNPSARRVWLSRITSYNVCYTKLLRAFDQVRQFVGDDVFDAGQGLRRQFQAEPDPPGRRVASYNFV